MNKKNAEAMKWLLDHSLTNMNLVHILAVHPDGQKLLPYLQNSEIVAFSISDIKEFGKKIGVEIGTN